MVVVIDGRVATGAGVTVARGAHLVEMGNLVFVVRIG